jgi:hypothetical protein
MPVLRIAADDIAVRAHSGGTAAAHTCTLTYDKTTLTQKNRPVLRIAADNIAVRTHSGGAAAAVVASLSPSLLCFNARIHAWTPVITVRIRISATLCDAISCCV